MRSNARFRAVIAGAFAAALSWTMPEPVPGQTEVPRGRVSLVVGSKKFTEGVILGDLATLLLRDAGYEVRHQPRLGGTTFCFNALETGEIDVYADYTGTLMREILSGLRLQTTKQLEAELAARGIHMTRPLGFNNTYALGMLPSTADRLGIRKISDLRDHPELRFGFGTEFIARDDCWPGLKPLYRLPHTDVRALGHEVSYSALAGGAVDVIDVYRTDAKIDRYDVRALEDDLRFFPEYEAVYLYRSELRRRAPRAPAALRRLEGRIDEATITRLNASVELGGRSPAAAAAAFLTETTGKRFTVASTGLFERLAARTKEHLLLVLVAMALGTLVAVPLGYAAFVWSRFGTVVLAVTGVCQTIPSLALLVFMIPLLGIEAPPAIAALFLYSLLPMVRNTYTGLKGIPSDIEESAEALGLSPVARVWRIELPLASRSIIAGIKTSFVLTVGFATLGAYIGAGGYGQPIFTGIDLDDFGLVLEGAIPAALLAVGSQLFFDGLERLVVPRGLRIRRVE